MDKRPSCEGRPFGFQRLEAGRCSRESEPTHRLHYRFRIMTGIHDAAGGDTTALLRASPPMTIWADGQSIQDSSVSAGSLLTHRATASEMSESRSRPAAARRTWRRTPRTVAVLLMNGRHVTRDIKRATADQDGRKVFDWMKTIALVCKTQFRGRDRVGWMFTFAAVDRP